MIFGATELITHLFAFMCLSLISKDVEDNAFDYGVWYHDEDDNLEDEALFCGNDCSFFNSAFY